MWPSFDSSLFKGKTWTVEIDNGHWKERMKNLLKQAEESFNLDVKGRKYYCILFKLQDIDLVVQEPMQEAHYHSSCCKP